MDYRNILATGFLLLCGAVFFHSLKSANAFPQGPNVSMGSNPYERAYVEHSSGGFVNTTQQDLMITDVTSSSSGIILLIDSTYTLDLGMGGNGRNGQLHLQSPLKLAPGETLSASHSYNFSFTGYYAHP